MNQHALGSPSSAETWFGCPGSLAMQKGLADDPSEYTDEGTAAHLLGSTCLEIGTSPGDYVGRRIIVGSNETEGFDGAVWEGTRPKLTFVTRRTYVVDDEMIEHVGNYVDRIRQYADGALLMVPERRVAIGFLTGEKDAHGTSDCAIVQPGELQTHDLKYGMGNRVSAKRNKQLMMYALANREELEMAYGPFERFRFVVHQPRLSSTPDEWDCTAAELDAFAEEVKAKASLALGLYEVGAKPTHEQWVAQYLNPSEDACHWCKAKGATYDGDKMVGCPALAKKLTDTFGEDFEAIASDFPVAEMRFERMTLGQKMFAIPLFETLFKAIRAELERQIFADPDSVPGWKIVQGKRGNRSWSDATAAEELLKKMRLSLEERYKMTLNSPPAIEKALKATPRRWKRVLDADLIEQREGQPSVAPADDPRPAWTPPDTANDFTAIEESIV